ncbi:VirB4 family type IV secretion/conjugal transfer ATPase (plasmid) [Sphaerotilaceae bacterium SBD11-9]
MGATPKFAKTGKAEEPCSAFVPYSNHVTKTIIKLKSGDYMAVLRMQGAAHESADASDINMWHSQLNNTMKNMASPKVALWTHVVRREYNPFPGGDFKPGFARDLNDRYRASMANATAYVNQLYLTIVFRPQPMKAGRWLDTFSKKAPQELAERQLAEIEEFKELIQATLASMDRYEPELLGCYEKGGVVYSEVREFLAFLIDGEWRPAAMARAELSEVLVTSRPFFSKGGVFALKGPARTQYGAVLAIQDYPSATCPGILNGLLSLPYEFVLSQSFTFLSKQVALGRMTRQHSRMVNAGDVAQSQVAEIMQAMDDLASNVFVMGEHNLAMVVRANDQKTLIENISDAGNIMSEAGIKFAREDVGMAAAFWSQLPGNFEYRVRSGAVTSLNFAAFSSFHNYPMGHLRGNQWGHCVTMFHTTAGSPYYFNWHKGEEGSDLKRAAKMDPNHKDLANTIIIGKSGTGKTVLQLFMLAQTMKFDEPVPKNLAAVFFDKDLGASICVRALGGRYYPVKNGEPTGWNPFQLEPTPGNLTFLEKLVRRLVWREGAPLTVAQEKEIAQAIAGVMRAHRPSRRLSALLQFLSPADPDGVYARLSRWAGRGAQLGWLFDNAVDTLNIEGTPVLGFDVTEFLENDETREPTLMYLLHRIQSLLDGRRVPIYFDEFGQCSKDQTIQDLVENKLVTIRKQDGFLVMGTQMPSQIINSPIAGAIIQQTATKIFLPNPEADRTEYVEGFKLTHREYELIRDFPEKSRKFLIKQGANSVVCRLNLGGFNDELAVLSGNTATSLLVEKLVAAHGEDPAKWLPEFHRIRKGV